MDSLRRKSVPFHPPEPLKTAPHAPTLLTVIPEKPIFKERATPLAKKTTLPVSKVKKGTRSRKKYVFFFLFFLLFCVGCFSFLLWKGLQTVDRIHVVGNAVAAPTLAQKLKTLQAAFLPGELAPLKGAERGRINILLLGKAGVGLPGENLTDTLMLASIDTRNKKIALLSLPRDLYVENKRYGTNGKINSFYQRDISERKEPVSLLKDSITTITGEPVDYFFVMDFAGFESVVDALNGITVDVPKDFYDPRYPGKNYSYETFELKKGWQRLDGPTALKYVRERHDDPEGDFGRAKRQQQVLQAIKNKALSPGTYLNFVRINKLFESVANNVETDITLPEMQSFYELAKDLDTQNINNQVIDAWKPESLLRVDHHTLGGQRVFTLVPRTGNWRETQELSKNIFSLDTLAKRKEMILREEATLTILDSGKTLQSADKLARYITREFGIETEVTYEPELERTQEPAMLVSVATLAKPFAFDELLKRLPISKETNLPEGISSKETFDTDFILTMDDTLATSFQNADEYYQNQESATEQRPDF